MITSCESATFTKVAALLIALATVSTVANLPLSASETVTLPALAAVGSVAASLIVPLLLLITEVAFTEKLTFALPSLSTVGVIVTELSSLAKSRPLPLVIAAA